MSKSTRIIVPCSLGHDLAFHALEKQQKALRANAAAVRQHNIEAVHDMRVASRRMRAALSELKIFLPTKPTERLAAHAKAITRNLGLARELDVSGQLLQTFESGLIEPATKALDHARAVIRALRNGESNRVCEAAARITTEDYAACSIEILGEPKPRPACAVERAPQRLEKRFDALCAMYETWQRSQTEVDLHEIRIAFKKLRYICEIYAPLYGRRVPPFIRRLKQAQEHLGDWNDLRMAIAYCADARANAPLHIAEGYEPLLSALTRKRDRLLDQWVADGHEYFSPARREATLTLFKTCSSDCCQK